ncbi:hypothetical protein NDU88_007493 [Pleurodeles waltl]|uniref:Uncharacterized protein n=1 Tax=Pleurodeles waltl TaxID=8319 RepID=A0AAV7QM22_PLEWA|nr:hypothetical protein NDU88_007493 [Pleurodeles waltl]
MRGGANGGGPVSEKRLEHAEAPHPLEDMERRQEGPPRKVGCGLPLDNLQRNTTVVTLQPATEETVQVKHALNKEKEMEISPTLQALIVLARLRSEHDRLHQARQIITTTKKHGPYQLENSLDYFAADTNAERKRFLALRLQLLKLDCKFGFMELATMIVMLNGRTWKFEELENLKTTLDILEDSAMEVSRCTEDSVFWVPLNRGVDKDAKKCRTEEMGEGSSEAEN